MLLPRLSEARPRTCALAALAAALAIASAPDAAWAQTKPAPTTKPAAKPPPARPAPSASSPGAAPPELIEGSDELQRLYMEGDAALKQGAFADAEASFTKAWALSRSFDVAGALGAAKLELARYREAAQYLSFALRNALPSTKPTARDRIKRDLDKAREHLATVKLTVSLLEAKISVDGAGVDPIFLGPEIYVDPGKRTFEATADGYTTAKSTIDARAGEIVVVTLTLDRTSAPKGGGPVPTAPPPQGTPWPAAVMGATGAAALVAGAVLIGAAETSKSRAYDLARNTLTPEGNPTCPKKGPGPTEQCDAVRAAAADADLFGNVGIGMFVGAGALLAGATAYMLFLRPQPVTSSPADEKGPAATIHLVPVIGPTGGGVVWRGSF